MKRLLKSQQGELDGVVMYRALAKAVKDPSHRETFLKLAADEGRHAAVFRRLTGKNLKPHAWKGPAITILYRILGKDILYYLIAQGEYAAGQNYETVVRKYPETASVKADEKRHGDTVMAMRSKSCDIKVSRIRIGNVPALVLRPKTQQKENAPGVLWIHGGGYIFGMKEMALKSRAVDLISEHGAIVIAPGYRLAWLKPYPAALKDCYKALRYLYTHAEALGVDKNRIIVGGESSGGGLAIATCILARDRGEIPVAFQIPLYPMISNVDTESSRDNHGRVWNTRRNHIGWWFYLRGKAKKRVSPYAAPIWLKDYKGLPPAYTFVGDSELFLDETKTYIRRLQEAGIEAGIDIYHTGYHAFDMLRPDDEISKEAIRKFDAYIAEKCFKEEKP